MTAPNASTPYVISEDEMPKRPRAHRRLTGKTTKGVEINGHAYADPIPGSLAYGPFYGEGNFSLSRGGSYVVGNITFGELPEIIALLEAVLRAAEAPGSAERASS